MQEYGISSRSRYSTISDSELEAVISSFVSSNPNLGERSVDGLLRSQGVVIQRQRLWDAMRAVDPEGVQLRLRRSLHRREYNVEAPNALWHVDGYHKLIRWKIVIHGGIDGFSRVVTYLKVATNNRAETAVEDFQNGVFEYGLPSRVWTDRGGKNVLIGEYMIEQRGIGRGSIILGRSVHNQRIERLWRDLFSGCICYFYHLFYWMDDQGIINIDSVTDICYCLHTVFLEKIQQHLDLFRPGWCCHRMRSEHNKTPNQMWIEGMNALARNNPEHIVNPRRACAARVTVLGLLLTLGAHAQRGLL